MNYWKLAIQDTNILVNGNPVTENYIIRNSDLLLHKTHRHEPPVFGEITLVGETSDLIAVCKPASMPSISSYFNFIQFNSFFYFLFYFI